MDKLLSAASMHTNKINLPSKDLLDRLSLKSSYNKSMNKLKVTDSLLASILADITDYELLVQEETMLEGFTFRVKTKDSIQRKLERHPDKNVQQVFNDILGVRIIVDEYPITYPDYYRVVDMRDGKAHDDGYRGVHLYYKRDNYSYIIEIQLWSKKDAEFNSWTHRVGYKTLTSENLLELRKMYDIGVIKSYEEYKGRALKYYG